MNNILPMSMRTLSSTNDDVAGLRLVDEQQFDTDVLIEDDQLAGATQGNISRLLMTYGMENNNYLHGHVKYKIPQKRSCLVVDLNKEMVPMNHSTAAMHRWKTRSKMIKDDLQAKHKIYRISAISLFIIFFVMIIGGFITIGITSMDIYTNNDAHDDGVMGMIGLGVMLGGCVMLGLFAYMFSMLSRTVGIYNDLPLYKQQLRIIRSDLMRVDGMPSLDYHPKNLIKTGVVSTLVDQQLLALMTIYKNMIKDIDISLDNEDYLEWKYQWNSFKNVLMDDMACY